MQFKDLTLYQREAVSSAYLEICEIVCPDKGWGHFNDCAYTDEHPECACAERGRKIHQELVDLVGVVDTNV